ncbi:MAG: hypothetical protein ACK5B9_07515 [Flavobacteriia bacterium]|jgi:hypothetical protein
MSVVETERTGILLDFYDEDTGIIKENGTGTDFDFARRGAQVDFVKNEEVIFITITTPNKKVIVKQILKKN